MAVAGGRRRLASGLASAVRELVHTITKTAAPEYCWHGPKEYLSNRLPLVLATPADVTKAENELWITFPKGYREYVTILGEGVLGGSFVRDYPPWRIFATLPSGGIAFGNIGFGIRAANFFPKNALLSR